MKKKVFALLTAAMMTVSAFTLLTGCSKEVTPGPGLANAEEVISFIENDVYGSVDSEMIPMMAMSLELDLSDENVLSYYTGLTDTTGIEGIVINESGVGSIPYSFIYVMTDGTNTEGIQTKLGESVNPAKWICVEADKIVSVQLDSDIVLIMSEPERTDAMMNAVLAAAADRFTVVGDVIHVRG